MTPSTWLPGLPTRNTRVALDCGARGAQLAGTVLEDGTSACVVRWDHSIVQVHPTSHLVPIDRRQTPALREVLQRLRKQSRAASEETRRRP